MFWIQNPSHTKRYHTWTTLKDGLGEFVRGEVDGRGGGASWMRESVFSMENNPQYGSMDSGKKTLQIKQIQAWHKTSS